MVAFRRGLAETGHVEGSALAIDFRWAEGQYARLPELAEELVGRGVSLIVATGGIISAQAARAATASIPIVFTSGFDPVALGLVSSLNKPGGNATGVSFFAGQLSGKRIGILQQLAPSAAIGLLINPKNPYALVESNDVQSAAALTGQTIRVLNASSEGDFGDLSASFDRERRSWSAVILCSWPSAIGSSGWQRSTPFPLFTATAKIVTDGGLLSYAQASPMRIVKSVSMREKFSMAQSRRIYPSCSQPDSSWSST